MKLCCSGPPGVWDEEKGREARAGYGVGGRAGWSDTVEQGSLTLTVHKNYPLSESGGVGARDPAVAAGFLTRPVLLLHHKRQPPAAKQEGKASWELGTA